MTRRSFVPISATPLIATSSGKQALGPRVIRSPAKPKPNITDKSRETACKNSQTKKGEPKFTFFL